jgi:hypothetical protein
VTTVADTFAAAETEIVLATPVELDGETPGEPTLSISRVYWEHTFDLTTRQESLTVRAVDPSTYRSREWPIVGNWARDRTLPAWIPEPPEGWDDEVEAQAASSSPWARAVGE